MALHFERQEAVEFGDLKAIPKINTELRMRLTQLKINQSNMAEGLDLLADCFPENRQQVREFLGDMFIVDIYKLQAYLIGGKSVLDNFESTFAELMKNTAVKEAGNE